MTSDVVHTGKCWYFLDSKNIDVDNEVRYIDRSRYIDIITKYRTP